MVVPYKELYIEQSLVSLSSSLNLKILLSTVSLTIASLNSSDYQKATIASVSLCFVVCLVTMAMHLWWNFNLKNIKRRLGFKDHQKYIPVPQVSANEDDEENRPLLGSPPSIVYGSRRGEHQFELVFPDPSCDNEESSSSVSSLHVIQVVCFLIKSCEKNSSDSIILYLIAVVCLCLWR